MTSLNFVKKYWRIILLVILLIASTAIIVIPAEDRPGESNEQVDLTNSTGGVAEDADRFNLKYGLELAGGTSVRAPLIGASVTDVQVPDSDRRTVSNQIAEDLGVEPFDVHIREEGTGEEQSNIIEVYQDVPPEELAESVEGTSVDTSDMQVEDDVSKQTYDEVESTLRARVVQSGLSGGQVTQASSADGARYITVQVPNEDQDTVLDLIGERGIISTYATYPVEGEDGGVEMEEDLILTQNGIQSVGQPEQQPSGQYGVSITLDDDAANTYVADLREYGFFEGDTASQCNLVEDEGERTTGEGYCLITYQDGEYIHGGGVQAGLLQSMESGDFVNSPIILLTTGSQEQAYRLQLNLEAGAMATNMDIDNGTIMFLSASQAEEFKMLSVVIGVMTIFAVAGSVAYRYRDPGVAAPMTLTAMSEVWLLLGFVALIELPLDLSHIAGLIAVVGTGVDDLIIIADEILADGGVDTDRVFESRFKKAFWVIGIAAITTIIAMSPLAILSLGDLQGFAIITIVGILIGVLITRPAYGDILKIITERRR